MIWPNTLVICLKWGQFSNLALPFKKKQKQTDEDSVLMQVFNKKEKPEDLDSNKDKLETLEDYNTDWKFYFYL